jgi:arylsulfatase A-like enzyme
VRAAYRAEVTANDRAFGALADSLRAQGILDDTLVIVTSDHGEEFWEHGKTMHGRTLYDEVLRVPLLVRFPRGTGPTAGARVAAQVGGIDILPTILESVGLPAPDDIAGRSLLRAAAGPAAGGYASLYLESREFHTLTLPPWKLQLERTTGEETLFDLRRDPHERSPVDIANNAEASEALERLRRLLAEITDDLPKHLPVVGTAELEIPPDARETLEALGYLE